MKNLVRAQKQKVEGQRNSRVLCSPQDILAARQQAVDAKTDRLRQAFRSVVAGKQQSFRVAAGKLAVLNPLAVLNRGFSVTRKRDGTLVRQVCDIELGEMVEIILRDGTLGAQISHKEETCEKNKE
jgi:exodeoxyribonuclease VII large subunit